MIFKRFSACLDLLCAYATVREQL
jgi:hypothetical protein